ncbi:MAG: very short patch repair endonuclease [Candidatus Margulisiibacteriota bacterium]|nr:very short patch repair endonuclease [Candidatus Margulisiibacteriota bacterium]
MVDTFSKKKRSSIMRAVRSRGNKSTELKFKKALRKASIKGWRSHPKLSCAPDFAFQNGKIAIFIDGCFWHGCKKHLRLPKSNVSYWKAKISRNINRDKIASKTLRGQGWKVLRIWEHTVNSNKALQKWLDKNRTILR